MTRLVLDCSITLAWCFEDEGSPPALSVLDALADGSAVVPSIWPLEVANVLAISERKRRLTAAESARFIAVLSALPITVDNQTSHRAFNEVLALVRAHRLTTYDAAYLELASREGLPVATLDNGLRKAARKLGVTVFEDRGAC